MSNDITRVQNTFGLQQNASVQTQISQSREVSEVQAQVFMAKQFPRNIVDSVDRIINECARTELAEMAVYAYPKGGQKVTGPSIRLAETLARCWGNIDYGIKEIEQKDGESSVIAYCWDLETNVKNSKTFKVKHEINAKGQLKKLSDPRDIYELVANQGARRVRVCILATIPSDVVDKALEQCEETTKATADTSPEGIKKLLKAFESFEITKEQLEKRIGSRIDAIAPAQVVTLRNIYASLKDGMSKPADWFDVQKDKDLEFKNLEDLIK